MIRYKKIVTYTEKDKPQKIYELEKKTFYTLDEALEYLQNTSLCSYINNKAITATESAEVIDVKNAYGDNPTYKKYYKMINTTGEEIGNIKEL